MWGACVGVVVEVELEVAGSSGLGIFGGMRDSRGRLWSLSNSTTVW